MKYSPGWDLSTIPDDAWASEHGRRNRAKGPQATNEKIEFCNVCGLAMNARERRKPCRNCGTKWPNKEP
jgi:hypothetical protein